MSLTIAKQATLAAAAGIALTVAAPANAVEIHGQTAQAHATDVLGDMTFEHKSKHRYKRHGYDYHDHDGYYGRRERYYDEPIYRDTRIWRGRDGRYYCRKEDGTTGLLIGAGVGALAGHELAGRGGDRTLGAILGAAGGAILGRAIDRSNSRCR